MQYGVAKSIKIIIPIAKVNLFHAEKKNQEHDSPHSSVLGETKVTNTVIKARDGS